MLTWEHILKHYHAMGRILLLNNGVLLRLWVEDSFLKWIWAQFLKQNVSNGERQDMIVLQSDECLDPSMRQIAISDGWMNSSWQKYPKIEKSFRILQPKSLDNNTRPTNPGMGCGTLESCLSRYCDAFIAATSACSWLKKPFRRCKVDYCYSTFDLHRQHRRSLLHRNRANSHTLRTKNLNSSYQGRKIKMKLADITIDWMKWRDEATRWDK